MSKVKQFAANLDKWAGLVVEGGIPDDELTKEISDVAGDIKPDGFAIGKVVQALMTGHTNNDREQAWSLLLYFVEHFAKKLKGRGDDAKAVRAWIEPLELLSREAAADREKSRSNKGGKDIETNDLRKFGVNGAKPPTYDGKQGGCAEWVTRMGKFLSDRSVPQSQWIAVYRDSCGVGQAYNTFSRLEEEDKDLPLTLKRMMMIFDIGRRDELIRAEMFCVQKRGQSAAAFQLEYMSLLDHLRAYDIISDAETQMDRYVCKLLNWKRVRAGAPATMERAVELASLLTDGQMDSMGSQNQWEEEEESTVPAVNLTKQKGKCWDFRDGKCKRGDKCRFLHEL
jgi:hypothetical protein